MTIAYVANSFPEPVEPYVWEEILELRKRGVQVLVCSMRRPNIPASEYPISTEEVEYAFPLRPLDLIRANWFLIRHFFAMRRFIVRALRGPEMLPRKLRTLAHTWLGAYLAARLAHKNIEHIHVHHGYFASWIGMVAAQILDAGFSMTLHGSDLLLRGDYLDTKLAACSFCCTVSEFNRRYLIERYAIASEKMVLRRLGVDLARWKPAVRRAESEAFSILSVGRLHPVKNHQFLILACQALKARGVNFRCIVAGEGPERGHLQEMIAGLHLQAEVHLLGSVAREQLPLLYSAADAVVLTSHSEGIPVALMEAMAMERLVIAPRLTGVPELVTDGVSGFLYSPGSIAEFVAKVEMARYAGHELDTMRAAAREQVERSYNGVENLKRFVAEFVSLLNAANMAARRFCEPSRLNELTANS